MEGLVRKCLVLVVFAALVMKEVSAAQHVVGGSQGWDESTDFSTWASGETFKVGDQLEFKYSSMHSVVELSGESAYKSCDIGTAIDSMGGGKSVVKLTKPGTRYFACGTMGHCDAGMKVKITTVSADASPSSSSSSSPTPTSSTPSNSSTPASTTPSSTPASSTSVAPLSRPIGSFIFVATLLFASSFFFFFFFFLRGLPTSRQALSQFSNYSQSPSSIL